MKKIVYVFLTALLCMATAATYAQVNKENCNEQMIANGWPSYYCDCKFNADAFTLPLDMQIYDSVWFDATLNDIANGLSAYLHSDCDMSFDVYIGCTAIAPKYQAIFTHNQTNTVNSQTIKEKLDEMGLGNLNQRFYICISPVNGLGGRLIASAPDKGFPSTCADPLRIFPGMNLLSTNTENVYIIDPSDIEADMDIVMQWVGNDNAPCQLTVTRGECNGTLVGKINITNKDQVFRLSAQEIEQAWENDELFYFHLSHAANTAGTLRCMAAMYEEDVQYVELCQGRALQLADTTLTQSTFYLGDTVHVADNIYAVKIYDLTITAPEPVRDTIRIKYSQLPYTYREQYTIPVGGINQDYDITILTPDSCDERYLLHVAHQLTTVTSSRDTTICYGGKYVSNGITYKNDFTDIQRTQLNSDTLLVDTIHVYFATSLDVINDTLRLKSNQLSSSYRYRGQRIKIPAFGDYEFDLYKPDGSGCMEKILLHVAHNVEMRYETISETLCQGKVFTYNGVEYTSSTTFADTLQRDADTYIITSVSVTFTAPEAIPDTLALKQAALPYLYRGQETINAFGDYDLTIRTSGECDERYLLHVYHAIDTLYETISETLCQGKSFTYNGVTYTSSTTFADTLQRDADTYVITSVSVTFTAPEAMPDTLALKQAELPYTYRGQETITTFGDYDLTIRTLGECDERYLLHVYHSIDTLYETISETLCQGKVFAYNGVEYTSSTTFADTLQRDADTYIITSVSVTFTAPEAIPDTLALMQAVLPYTYRGQETITTFGDYDLTIRTLGECDERYLLHVYHAIDTLYETISETLCQGKVFTYKGQDITTDIAFLDTAMYNADTCIITSVSATFTAPEAIPDTLALKQAALPYTYRGQETINAFGNYDLTIRTIGECDERYLLHVYHAIDTLYETVSETLCQGKSFTYNGVTYTSSTTFADTLQRDADTYVITSVSVTFTAPEATPDTLALKQAALPYLYRGQETITTFGDYDLTIRTAGECDERYLLHVYHDIDTLYTNIDTTLCEGRIFIHNELEYTQPAILLDSNWLNMDTWQITTIDIAFTTPDMEYDTIVVKTEELLAGYYYEPADTMVYAAGDYFYEILTYNDCTRHLTLTVNEELTSAVDNLPCTEQPRLIMRNGVVYILRGKDRFTLLGEKW